MPQITVTLDDNLNARLESESREQGIPPEAVVRRLLEDQLREQPPPRNALELARELGLIGCFEGLPPDLSTNPNYLEGFGE